MSTYFESMAERLAPGQEFLDADAFRAHVHSLKAKEGWNVRFFNSSATRVLVLCPAEAELRTAKKTACQP